MKVFTLLCQLTFLNRLQIIIKLRDGSRSAEPFLKHSSTLFASVGTRHPDSGSFKVLLKAIFHTYVLLTFTVLITYGISILNPGDIAIVGYSINGSPNSASLYFVSLVFLNACAFTDSAKNG